MIKGLRWYDFDKFVNATETRQLDNLRLFAFTST